MATPRKAATLSYQDLAELIALSKGADNVELKLTVPVSERSRGAAPTHPRSTRQGRRAR